jgi:hypothetical protein
MNSEPVERGSEATLPIPAHEVDTEQQRWRERTLRGLLWAGFSAIAFAAVWFLTVQHRAPHITATTVAFAILLGVVALAKGLPFTIRALILFGSLYVACTVSIAVGGFSPNAFVGFATAVILASLLFGRNTGFATIALVAATLILVALGHRSGVIVRMEGWAEIIDSTSVSNLVRMIGVFVLLTATIEGFRELHQGGVLLCSGYAPSETGISLELVDDFLPKPFGGELLIERVLSLATPRPG